MKEKVLEESKMKTEKKENRSRGISDFVGRKLARKVETV